MRIEYKGAPPYHDFTLDGTVLKINGSNYDLDALRRDEERIINIYDKKGNYIANIIIPPNEYDLVDTGKKDENGNPIFDKKLKPINLEKVRLILWSKIEIENNTDEEV